MLHARRTGSTRIRRFSGLVWLLATGGLTASAARASIILVGAGSGVPYASVSQIDGQWSTDLGPRYHVDSTGANNIGTVLTTNPWALNTYHTNETVGLDFDSLGTGADVGPIEAHESLAVGAGGPVTPTEVHELRFDATTYNQSGSYGSGSEGNINVAFLFQGVSIDTPLYWVAEWSLQVSNPLAWRGLSSNSELTYEDGHVANQVYYQVFTQPGDQMFIGSASGMTDRGVSAFHFNYGLGSQLASNPGRLQGDLRIAFWDQPFTSIPGGSEVPEPGTIWTFAAGVGLIQVSGLLRWRRRS